jgi:hypothetical protein
MWGQKSHFGTRLATSKDQFISLAINKEPKYHHHPQAAVSVTWMSDCLLHSYVVFKGTKTDTDVIIGVLIRNSRTGYLTLLCHCIILTCPIQSLSTYKSSIVFLLNGFRQESINAGSRTYRKLQCMHVPLLHVWANIQHSTQPLARIQD